MIRNAFNYVASGQIVATTNYSDIKTDGSRGVVVFVDVTAIDATTGDESYVYTIQGKDDLGGDYYTLLSSANLRAGGAVLTVLEVHPALTEATNLRASRVLPDKIRVIATLSGTTPIVTASIRIVLVP